MNNQITRIYLASILALFGSTDCFSNGNVPPAEAPAPAAQVAPADCSCCYTPDPAWPDSARFFRGGVYLGAQVGYEHTGGRLRGDYTDPKIDFTSPYSVHRSPNGVIGEVFVGGRYLLKNCMFIGAELGGVISSNQLEKNLTVIAVQRDFNLKVERLFAVIPSATIGYVLNHRWMVYGRAGLAVARFHSEVHDVDNQGSNTHLSHTKTMFGFAPALGLECAFSPTMSARGEIGGELYGSMHNSNNVVNGDLTEIVTVKAHANFFNAKVGVVIKI